MNQKFVFAFILLATLFMVNTTSHQFHKRATTFNQCTTTTKLNVTITPDPLAAGNIGSFNVSGTLANDISTTSQLVIIFTDANQGPLAPPYIQTVSPTQSVKAGTPFTVIASQVPVPPNLPESYGISAVVGDPANPPNLKQPLNIYGCAAFGALSDTYSVVGMSYPVASSPN